MKIEEFKNCCSDHGLHLSDKQLEQYLQYATLLKEWNEKMNLTAITALEEVLDKHFFDSLLPSFSFNINGRLCDVGAGAGFPSIPLKIAYPNIEVVIVEPLNKRITFLKEVIKELGLEHIHCYHARAEDYAKNNRETFDVVTARAVANLTMLAELCIPLVKIDGTFLAMKGSQGEQEAIEASYATKLLGCGTPEIKKHFLQDGSSRVNLYYKKIKNTPKSYPRIFGKIKKEPLLKEK